MAGMVQRRSQVLRAPYKMVLIGETGSGKTSFLNLLSNYATMQTNFGVANFKQFNDMKLEVAQSCPMASKTSGAKLYNVMFGELKLGIIDTPGFGDTSGMTEDEENVKKIIATLQGEKFINCICLIINGRNCRSTVGFRNIMSEIAAILPREILNNIIVVFSNTANELDLNFDASELQTYFGRDIVNLYYIDNPYCKFEKAKQKRHQFPLERIAKSLQKSFKITAQSFDRMYTTMKEFKLVPSICFITLFDKKTEIEKKLLQMLTSYDSQRRLQENVKQAQDRVDTAQQIQHLNKDYSITSYRNGIVMVHTSNHNTLCGVSGCHSNCHTSCGCFTFLIRLTFGFSRFDKEIFKFCHCMSGNYCTQCGHHYTHHYHVESKFEERREQVTQFSSEMKRIFDDAKAQEKRAHISHDKLKAELEESLSGSKRASNELRLMIKEFQELGVKQSYAKLLDIKRNVIEAHLKGTVGSETGNLLKAKEEIEKKLAMTANMKIY